MDEFKKAKMALGVSLLFLPVTSVVVAKALEPDDIKGAILWGMAMAAITIVLCWVGVEWWWWNKKEEE